MARNKDEIITFKVDASLREALATIHNRSEFIRAAILAALDSTCPLCQGSGILSPNQKRHWREFSATHDLRTCGECDELHLVCARKNQPTHHPGSKKRPPEKRVGKK